MTNYRQRVNIVPNGSEEWHEVERRVRMKIEANYIPRNDVKSDDRRRDYNFREAWDSLMGSW